MWDEDDFSQHRCLEDKIAAANWARAVLSGGKISGKYGEVVFLDTETTGLAYNCQPIQIAVVSKYGSPMLNTYIKPTIPIEPGATGVHGITEQYLVEAPTFKEIYPRLKSLLENKYVVIYNASYDTKVLFNAVLAHSLTRIKYKFGCAMMKYAAYYGDYSSYWGNYKWQKLPGGNHDALGDAVATYKLVKSMASWQPEKEIGLEEKTKLFPPLQLGCKWERALKLEISAGAKDRRYWQRVRELYISLPKFYLMR